MLVYPLLCGSKTTHVQNSWMLPWRGSGNCIVFSFYSVFWKMQPTFQRSYHSSITQAASGSRDEERLIIVRCFSFLATSFLSLAVSTLGLMGTVCESWHWPLPHILFWIELYVCVKFPILGAYHVNTETINLNRHWLSGKYLCNLLIYFLSSPTGEEPRVLGS